MKQTLKLLSGIILLSVSGCDIENIDKSPRGETAVWEKLGADSTEIGKALLECGLPHLNYLEDEVQKLSDNDSATIDACMIQAGFHYKGRGYWCSPFRWETLPICQRGAVIPKRSVEKRLNSPFCKESPVQPECKP
ncbi:hypothetical protein [Bartonella harrusi]|uniref:Phage protein n=1 Tax=Bartonella harrusi TaxID=2961895 RepID=A0ABY5EUC1_9HYPH|nr:hypothetical protein [Bartonella harrusi]UTO28999.1 hypothetical protein NMK50_03225 [Bartonella harrusi]